MNDAPPKGGRERLGSREAEVARLVTASERAGGGAAVVKKAPPSSGGRKLRSAVLVLIAIGVVASAGLSGGGWYFSDQLLRPSHPPPAYDITVHSSSATAVVLERTSNDARPGTWGLAWPTGHAIVGSVESMSAETVTRTLERATSPILPGTRVAMSSQVYWGDPQQALGIPFQNVDVSSEVGPLPAWFVPGTEGTFAIVVHGYNSPITDGMRVLASLAKLGLPVLLIHYRNDAGAPASPDGLIHLGDTEWRDVEAAVRWTIADGARSVALVGISMGGAVVEMFMQRSALARHVSAVVLDSPVLGWDAVLHFQARRRNLPDVLVGATELVLRLRIGFDVATYDLVRDAASVRAPTLLFQDGQDTFVPPDQAALLAKARPDIVEYHFYPTAGHVEEWNVDPVGYAATLSSFLTRKLNLA